MPVDPNTINRGVPAAQEGASAIQVGSIADLHRLGADAEPNEGSFQLNPAQDPEALVTPAEHDASKGKTTQETERKGLSPSGQYDDFTKEELQAEAERQGVSTSGTKDEIKARLS